jgi:putative ABC transport system ATP-binding protein
MKENIIVDAKDLIKTFKDGKVETRVLKGVNLKVHEGEFVAIMGRSGAGKSTCMYQLSLLDEPTSGEIKLLGKNTEGMSREERTKFRLYNLGYVFQDYALLPELSALENVALPLLMKGLSRKQAY